MRKTIREAQMLTVCLLSCFIISFRLHNHVLLYNSLVLYNDIAFCTILAVVTLFCGNGVLTVSY